MAPSCSVLQSSGSIMHCFAVVGLHGGSRYRCVPKIGFSADIFLDISIDMYIDMFIHIFMDISIDICIDNQEGVDKEGRS